MAKNEVPEQLPCKGLWRSLNGGQTNRVIFSQDHGANLFINALTSSASKLTGIFSSDGCCILPKGKGVIFVRKFE